MKIMIVEDNPKIRQLIRYVLDESLNAFVDCFDGADALETYAIHHPDLVLMDIQMPGMDGLTATRLLRDRYPNAKIHILSDHDEGYIRRAAAEAGACGYTSKIDLDQLDMVISRYSSWSPGS